MRSACGKGFLESHQCHLHVPTGRVSRPTLGQILHCLRLSNLDRTLRPRRVNRTPPRPVRNGTFGSSNNGTNGNGLDVKCIKLWAHSRSVAANAASPLYPARLLMQARFEPTATNCTPSSAFIFGGHTSIRLRKALFQKSIRAYILTVLKNSRRPLPHSFRASISRSGQAALGHRAALA